MIEMRRGQRSFGDGLIVAEVRDLREDWMEHADAVLADEALVAVGPHDAIFFNAVAVTGDGQNCQFGMTIHRPG